MKKAFSILLIIFSFTASISFADSNNNPAKQQDVKELLPSAATEEAGSSKEYIAEQKVKMLPAKHGRTIDSYLTNMTKIPMAEDLGWKVRPVEDGYEVERSILIKGSKTFRYTWKVLNSGEVSPVNDRAKSLMK